MKDTIKLCRTICQVRIHFPQAPAHGRTCFFRKEKAAKSYARGRSPLAYPPIAWAIFLRPWPGLFCLPDCRPLRSPSASLSVCMPAVSTVSSVVSSRGASVRRSPLLGSLSLTGRQAEFFKSQSPRRRTGNSRGNAALHLHPMSEKRESRTVGSGDFLVTFCSHKK